MTYDFYADEPDKIKVLDFIFQETDLQVFDLAAPPGQMVREYSTTAEIISNFDLRNGNKFAVTFQLYTQRLKGDIVFRKIELDPKRCNGQTFRYSTDGWGLIQLYFGGLVSNELKISHIGHQSEKRATAWVRSANEVEDVKKWDWREVEKVARGLKYHVHNKMARRKIGSVDVLAGADELGKLGISFS